MCDLQSAIVNLVQKLVGLPLRAPPGYAPGYNPSTTCARQSVNNQLEPFKVGEDTRKTADTLWQTHLQRLAEILPREAGKLTRRDLVGSSQ